MMLYRSLVLGMLGAIALMVASPRPAPSAAADPAAPVTVITTDAPRDGLTVVDVSRAAARGDLLPLLGLTPGERVVGIGGIPAVTADLVTRWQYTLAEKYLDIAVRGERGEERRILVLAHP
jgi:hypothetical protein